MQSKKNSKLEYFITIIYQQLHAAQHTAGLWPDPRPGVCITDTRPGVAMAVLGCVFIA